MEGNATRNAALEAARLSQARALIVSAGRDDTSILIVLTARRIAPDLPISVVIRSEDNEAIARQAGADVVINPASFAGLLLAISILVAPSAFAQTATTTVLPVNVTSAAWVISDTAISSRISLC